MLRDGMHQTAIHTGLAPYRRTASTAASRCRADAERRRLRADPAAGRRRTSCARKPVSFDDHFSQADDVLPQPEPRSSRRTSSRRSPSSWASATSRRSRNANCRCWPTSTPTCAQQVAAGLGLPAPKGSPPSDVTVSPALSQTAGRARADRRPQGRHHRRRRIRPRRHRASCVKRSRKLGVTALVIAPVGGKLKSGRRAGDRRPDVRHGAVDRVRRRRGRRRAPRRAATSSSSCCCRRRSGTARRWPPGATAPRSSRPHRIPLKGPGVEVADDVDKDVHRRRWSTALGLHRAWDRAAKVMASAVPPAGG